jgi:hypothetical protein
MAIIARSEDSEAAPEILTDLIDVIRADVLRYEAAEEDDEPAEPPEPDEPEIEYEPAARVNGAVSKRRAQRAPRQEIGPDHARRRRALRERRKRRRGQAARATGASTRRKLDADATEIRRLFHAGLSSSALAREYGVTHQTIPQVARRLVPGERGYDEDQHAGERRMQTRSDHAAAALEPGVAPKGRVMRRCKEAS